MTKTARLSERDLMQFTGSENWYRHAINRNVLFTDGAKYVADEGSAYWLLDEIAIIQPYNKAVPPRSSRRGSSPCVPTAQRRSPATTATATSSSAKRSSTRIFRLMKSLSGSPTTPSVCRANINRPARAGILAGAGFLQHALRGLGSYHSARRDDTEPSEVSGNLAGDNHQIAIPETVRLRSSISIPPTKDCCGEKAAELSFADQDNRS